jgi:hypothetical protein
MTLARSSRQKLAIVAVLLALVSAAYGWGYSYVTLATNDQAAYVPVLVRAISALCLSQILAVASGALGSGPWRAACAILFAANLMPLYHCYIRAPFVFS